DTASPNLDLLLELRGRRGVACVLRGDLLVGRAHELLVHRMASLAVVLGQKLSCGGVGSCRLDGRCQQCETHHDTTDHVICCTDHVCAVHPLAPKLLTHQESNARSIKSVLESTRHSVGNGRKGVLNNCLTPFHKSASGVRSAEPPVMIDQQRGKEAGQ